MLKLLKFSRAPQIITLIYLYQHTVAGSYASLPNAYNSPTNAYAFATPLPCDSRAPPAPSPHPTFEESYGAAYDKPLLFASYPVNYATFGHVKYAAAPVAVAVPPPPPPPPPPYQTFVRYASATPRVRVTAGAPVTTTYTTALGFAAPPPPPSSASSAPVPMLSNAAFQGFVSAPPINFAAPPSGYSYAAPPTLFSSANYAGANFFSALPFLKKFRTPLSVETYAYAQGAATPNGLW